jgi:hypothetical protein
VSGITCTDLSEMTALKKRKDCTIQTEYSPVDGTTVACALKALDAILEFT